MWDFESDKYGLFVFPPLAAGFKGVSPIFFLLFIVEDKIFI
jgi:hypothetical protein